MLHWLRKFHIIRNRYVRGLWTEELVEEAKDLAIRYPNKFTRTLYIDIQHSRSGFDNKALEFVNSFQLKSSTKTSLSLRLRLLALNLEYGLIDTISPDDVLGRHYSRHLLKSYPSILALLDEQMPKLSAIAPSIILARSLLGRTASFDTFVTHRQPSTVAVVGNSPAGLGLGAGEKIDACDFVIRFNNAVDRDRYAVDYGVKTDCWVISPAFKPRIGNLVSSKIAVTGVNPFSKRGLFWKNLSALEKTSVLLFPTTIWYDLVDKLNAPPSAGLLCLYALYHSGTYSEDIQIHGFGTDESANADNHYADGAIKSSRHNWAEESRLVQDFIENRLGEKVSGS